MLDRCDHLLGGLKLQPMTADGEDDSDGEDAYDDGDDDDKDDNDINGNAND